jgi:hypothetical protein
MVAPMPVRRLAQNARTVISGLGTSPALRLRSAVRVAIGVAGFLAGIHRLEAQTATQVVTFSVIRPALTAMTSPSAAFNTSSIRPSVNSTSSTRASVTGSNYAISTNESNQKIAASLVAPMPRGVSLAASLTPPVGAWSRGATQLGVTARDVVGGVSRSSSDSLALEYTLVARADAPRATLNTVVTFTITGGV